MPLQAYISGPLTDLPDDRREALKRFYEELGAAFEQMGKGLGYDTVSYVPHRYCDPVLHAHWTPDEVKKIDRANVKNSHLLVMYTGFPSHGVGREHEWAIEDGTPIIALCDAERLAARKISRLARADVDKMIAFTSFRQAIQEFEDELTTLLPDRIARLALHRVAVKA